MASWHGIGKSLSAWTIALEKREIWQREREREREYNRPNKIGQITETLFRCQSTWWFSYIFFFFLMHGHHANYYLQLMYMCPESRMAESVISDDMSKMEWNVLIFLLRIWWYIKGGSPLIMLWVCIIMIRWYAQQ